MDLGISSIAGKPNMHYENNGLDYYYCFQNKSHQLEVTRPLQAVIVHDMNDIINRFGYTQPRKGVKAIRADKLCELLGRMDDRPWGVWNGLIPKYNLPIRPISPSSLTYLLKDPETNIRSLTRDNGRIIEVTALKEMLRRYPVRPVMDWSKYTREPRYERVGTEGFPSRRGRGTLWYRLGDIVDYVADPFPVLIDSVSRSKKQVIYCITSEWFTKNLVKIGHTESLKTLPYRMEDYRTSEKWPKSPTVLWAIQVPTRIVLERRLHNLFMDRRVSSEFFRASPKLWSHKRMLHDAIEICKNTGSKYRVLKVHPTTFKVS